MEVRWWCLVTKAMRPVTNTLLGATRTVHSGNWMRTLRRLLPEEEEPMDVIQEEPGTTAMLSPWLPNTAPTSLRALSHMNKRELQQELQRNGLDTSDPSLSTVAQMTKVLKLIRPDKETSDTKGLSRMKVTELRRLCAQAGFDSTGMTADRRRLHLRGWQPSTLPASSQAAAMPETKAKATMGSSSTTAKSKTMIFNGRVTVQTPSPVKSVCQNVPMTPGRSSMPSSIGQSGTPDRTIPAGTPGVVLQCPLHTVNMILKRNSLDGSLFWGCPHYPNCRVTQALEATEFTPAPATVNPGLTQASAEVETMRIENEHMAEMLRTQQAELERQRSEMQVMADNAQQQCASAFAEIQEQPSTVAPTRIAWPRQQQQRRLAQANNPHGPQDPEQSIMMTPSMQPMALSPGNAAVLSRLRVQLMANGGDDGSLGASEL